MANRYIYHYCAAYQEIPSAINYIDGIAQMEDRIVTIEDYRELKAQICEDHAEILTIRSLSFIGMESEVSP